MLVDTILSRLGSGNLVFNSWNYYYYYYYYYYY